MNGPHLVRPDGDEPVDDHLAQLIRDALAPATSAPVPVDLVPATLAAVRDARQVRPAFRLAGLVAAAAVLVVGVGIALLGARGTGPVGPGVGTAAPSHGASSQASMEGPSPSAAPPASASPAASAPAVLVDGLPVITVAQAVAIRDDPARTTAEPLAVAGWFQAAPLVPCPAPPSVLAPLQPRCPDSMASLMADPEVLSFTNADGSGGTRSPTGLYLTPRSLSGLIGDLGFGGPGPVPAVLVGHFHDPSAADCPASDRTACEQAYVIESSSRWPVPNPSADTRLSCHDALCLRAAAAVAVADPAAYARAARIAFTGLCPPWLQCPRTIGLYETVVLVPPDWRGDPAALESWLVGAASADAPLTITSFTQLDDYALTQVGGYTVTCGSVQPDACYNLAVVIARAALRTSSIPIQSIDIYDQCGSHHITRIDGTGIYVMADCFIPSPSPTPSPSAVAGTPAFPLTALGLQVIDVAQAIRERDTASWAGASIVAVRGWYTRELARPCPWSPGVDDLERGCPGDAAFLAEDSQRLVEAHPGSISTLVPTGPSLNPRFVGAATASGYGVTSGPGDYSPVPVVMVGHWDDGRAAYCTDGAAAACANAFVVDGIPWIDGRSIDPVAAAQDLVSHGGSAVTSPAADVAAAVRAQFTPADRWTITSMAAAADDPRLVALANLDRSRPAWLVGLVRFGGSPPVTPETRTVVVVDGTTTVRELPAWPVRVDAAQRLPTLSTKDGPGQRVTCVGVAPADCLAAAATVATADPTTAGTAGQVFVVPGSPAWAAWSDPALAAVHLVAIVPSSTAASAPTHAYVVPAVGTPQPLPDGTMPSWLERAVQGVGQVP